MNEKGAVMRQAWLLLLLIPALATAQPVSPGSAAADGTIERLCQGRWPADYAMRVHCERNQRAAVRGLQEPIYDVPTPVAEIIRTTCARRWPTDFDMRLHCQQTQIQAAKELKNP